MVKIYGRQPAYESDCLSVYIYISRTNRAGFLQHFKVSARRPLVSKDDKQAYGLHTPSIDTHGPQLFSCLLKNLKGTGAKMVRQGKSLCAAMVAVCCCCLTWPGPVVGQQELIYSILEEQPPNQALGNLAFDAGLSSSEGLRCAYLEPGSDENERYLTIEENSCQLSTNRSIDREEICPGAPPACFIEDLVIIDPPFTVVRLFVEVTDLNEFAPQFPNPSLDLELSETTAVGSGRLLEAASDQDSGNNSVQAYQLIEDPHVQGTFRLDVTDNVDGSKLLQLVVAKKLDREVTSTYRLTLRALDYGQPQLAGEMVININVSDSNDNSPQFDFEAYTASILEGTPVGTSIIQLQASDPDEGTNAEITYSFGGGQQLGAFSINSVTGVVSTAAELDADLVNLYQISIMATDGASKNERNAAYTLLSISVEDINDNSPTITFTLTAGGDGSVAELSELAPTATTLALITAKDEDSNKESNGKVNIYLTGEDAETFGIQKIYDGRWLLVTARLLDFESITEYSLTITAQDEAIQPKFSTEVITVRVLDENDNPPVFQALHGNVAFTGNNQVGALVTTVTATDADSGQNGQVRYRLLEGQEHFEIGEDSGQITARVVLDWQQQAEISVRVEACDAAPPPAIALCANATRVVGIRNDHPPVFTSQSYLFRVQENLPTNSLVGRVEAMGDDESKLSYSLAAAGEVIVVIDSDTGSIRTSTAFDYEKTKEYSTVVYVNDGGYPAFTAEAAVRLIVEDVNDNRPDISYPTEDTVGYLPLASGPGFTVFEISASDGDEGQNGKLNYAISEGNDGAIFTVDKSTGRVSTKVYLMDKWIGLHQLTFLVWDEGEPSLSSSVKVHVILSDLPYNDSLQQNYTLVFSEPPEFSTHLELTFIIAISLAAFTFLLVIAIIAVIAKGNCHCCRRAKEKRNKYNCRQQALNSLYAVPSEEVDAAAPPPPKRHPSQGSLGSLVLPGRTASIGQASLGQASNHSTWKGSIETCDEWVVPPPSNHSPIDVARSSSTSSCEKDKEAEVKRLIKMLSDPENCDEMETRSDDSGRGESEHNLASTKLSSPNGNDPIHQLDKGTYKVETKNFSASQMPSQPGSLFQNQQKPLTFQTFGYQDGKKEGSPATTPTGPAAAAQLAASGSASPNLAASNLTNQVKGGPVPDLASRPGSRRPSGGSVPSTAPPRPSGQQPKESSHGNPPTATTHRLPRQAQLVAGPGHNQQRRPRPVPSASPLPAQQYEGSPSPLPAQQYRGSPSPLPYAQPHGRPGGQSQRPAAPPQQKRTQAPFTPASQLQNRPLQIAQQQQRPPRHQQRQQRPQAQAQAQAQMHSSLPKGPPKPGRQQQQQPQQPQQPPAATQPPTTRAAYTISSGGMAAPTHPVLRVPPSRPQQLQVGGGQEPDADVTGDRSAHRTPTPLSPICEHPEGAWTTIPAKQGRAAAIGIGLVNADFNVNLSDSSISSSGSGSNNNGSNNQPPPPNAGAAKPSKRLMENHYLNSLV